MAFCFLCFSTAKKKKKNPKKIYCVGPLDLSNQTATVVSAIEERLPVSWEFLTELSAVWLLLYPAAYEHSLNYPMQSISLSSIFCFILHFTASFSLVFISEGAWLYGKMHVERLEM